MSALLALEASVVGVNSDTYCGGSGHWSQNRGNVLFLDLSESFAMRLISFKATSHLAYFTSVYFTCMAVCLTTDHYVPYCMYRNWKHLAKFIT